MQDTFWQHDHFLLFNPETPYKVNGEWEFGTICDITELAEDSLITFNSGNLGEKIAEGFGLGIDDDIVFAKQAKPPSILRVQYDVSADDPKKFQDLRKIVVDMTHAERKPSGLWELTEPGAALMTYRLIAEVCLSSSPKVKDTIRTYLAEGEVIRIPTTFPNHMSEPLGKANARYMLYYCYGVKDIPGEDMYSEILPPFDMAKAKIWQDVVDGNSAEPSS
ncbi:hypothetical protein GL218_06434 [Daldinia childiae]|uniref:uncharacterized protein n=1 Tax=Daldinia childiae TaxID=326645 RepID=UPI0014486522|nr:uncharacterized protein GL218_06434 [Daldinia childiae]KAF3056456.1 hypothetical protein GL218_06434 [Daldinia childiae]